MAYGDQLENIRYMKEADRRERMFRLCRRLLTCADPGSEGHPSVAHPSAHPDCVARGRRATAQPDRTEGLGEEQVHPALHAPGHRPSSHSGCEFFLIKSFVCCFCEGIETRVLRAG